MTKVKRRKGSRISCDVGEVTEMLENKLIFHLRHFTYVTAYSRTLLSLYLRHSSFFIPSVASPTPQLILQAFFRASYVTGSSFTSPGEPPMEIWIVRNKDEDKISGHSTVEQATTVYFTEMVEG